jgi:Uma2 family endonuclease
MTFFEEIETAGATSIMDLVLESPMILDRHFTKEEFTSLSQRYPDMQMEREKDGKIIVMSPVKAGSGFRESIVIGYLFAWCLKTKSGKTYSSSTGVELADHSIRSPDCAWVSEERLSTLTKENLESDYLPVAPDFIAEVRSKSDRLRKLKKKMTDSWMKNGVHLGWLIDPFEEKVYIYRQGREVEVISGFSGKKLSGETIMPGMELPLGELKI